MDLKSQLSLIHSKVYSRFTYETDMEQYHVVDKWVMPPDNYDGTSRIVGDCEDFALACRSLCNDAKLQSRLIYCTIDDQGHCVLECEGWVLDCRFPELVDRDYLQAHERYIWKRISGYNAGDPWYTIE